MNGPRQGHRVAEENRDRGDTRGNRPTSCLSATSRPIRVAVLTDFNVSNVHYMLAAELRGIPTLRARYLDCGARTQRENDPRWFMTGSTGGHDTPVGMRAYLSMAGRLLFAIPVVLASDIVLTSGWIAVVPRFVHKNYIYWSYGSDLDQYAFRGSSALATKSSGSGAKGLATEAKRTVLRRLYRWAIEAATVTCIVSYQWPKLRQVGYRKVGSMPHILEPEFLSFDIDNKAHYVNELRREFDADWLGFTSTRHVWSQDLKGEVDYKGNDVVLKAFARFLEQCRSERHKKKLVLVERGRDCEKSKALIEQLGISPHVVWLREMPRRDLLNFYAGADVCFDQFSVGCLAASSIEAMACGTPVISYLGESAQRAWFPAYRCAPPVLNLLNPDDIADSMAELYAHPSRARELQRASYEWVQRECSVERRRLSLLKLIESALRT